MSAFERTLKQHLISYRKQITLTLLADRHQYLAPLMTADFSIHPKSNFMPLPIRQMGPDGEALCFRVVRPFVHMYCTLGGGFL